MAQKIIETTGCGESLKSGFAKSNDNFTELYSLIGTGGVTLSEVLTYNSIFINSEDPNTLSKTSLANRIQSYRVLPQSIGSDYFAYLVLSVTDTIQGDIVFLNITFPASEDPTIFVSSSLDTSTAIYEMAASGSAFPLSVKFTFNGTNWEYDSAA